MKLQIAIALAFTCIIPAGVGLFYWNTRGYSKAVRMLVLLAFVAVITESIGLFFILNRLGSTLFLFYPYTVLEAWIMLALLNEFVKSRIIFPIAPAVVTTATIAEAIFHSWFYNGFSTFLEGGIIVSVLIYIIYRVSLGNNMRTLDLALCVVALFYFVTNLVYFISVNFITGNAVIFMTNIHSVTNALSNILYGYCLWKLGHIKSSQSVLLF